MNAKDLTSDHFNDESLFPSFEEFILTSLSGSERMTEEDVALMKYLARRGEASRLKEETFFDIFLRKHIDISKNIVFYFRDKKNAENIQSRFPTFEDLEKFVLDNY